MVDTDGTRRWQTSFGPYAGHGGIQRRHARAPELSQRPRGLARTGDAEDWWQWRPQQRPRGQLARWRWGPGWLRAWPPWRCRGHATNAFRFTRRLVIKGVA